MTRYKQVLRKNKKAQSQSKPRIVKINLDNNTGDELTTDEDSEVMSEYENKIVSKSDQIVDSFNNKLYEKSSDFDVFQSISSSKEWDKSDHKNEDKSDHKNEDKSDHKNEDKSDHKNEDKSDHKNEDKSDHKNEDKSDHKNEDKSEDKHNKTKSEDFSINTKSIKMMDRYFGESSTSSTSKSEPKQIISSQNKDLTREKWFSSEMHPTRDVSTDSRYKVKHLESNKEKPEDKETINKNTNEGLNQLITTVSTPLNNNKPFICGTCDDTLESKKQFYTHFDEKHGNDINILKWFKKVETLTISVTTPSVDCPTNVKKRSKKRNTEKLKPFAVIETSDNDFNVNNFDNIKAKNHLMCKVVQKCKICTFTPLVNSMETIIDHIRTEHHKNDDDLEQHYNNVIVSFKK